MTPIWEADANGRAYYMVKSNKAGGYVERLINAPGYFCTVVRGTSRHTCYAVDYDQAKAWVEERYEALSYADPDYDPTPFCLHCGPKSACNCPPFADNH